MASAGGLSWSIDAAVRLWRQALQGYCPQAGPIPAGCVSKRRAMRCEEGGALVEFAVTLPVLLTFIFGLMQVCLACYTREMISEAAREATRYAMVRGSTCVTGSGSSCTVTAAQVNSFASATGLPNLGGGTMTATTTYPGGSETPGSPVQVQVVYAFPFRVPYVPTSTLTMSATSTMYILQ
jgi:Flp pilus assembly protein TadG